MYSKILIPLDGSKLAERVIPHGLSFARAFDAPVELLQVIENVASPLLGVVTGQHQDAAQEELRNSGMEYLEQHAASLGLGESVTCSVAMGNPADVIVESAKASKNTLIAMLTHGRSGVQRWVLGSVADKVVHASENPMLLVRATEASVGAEAKLKAAIVPLDGSPLAERALPHAIAIARKMDTEIILIQAYTAITEPYYGAGPDPDYTHFTRVLVKDSTAYLEEKVRQLKTEGLERVSYVLEEAEPAAKVIDLADATTGSLVVMATHGKSGVSRWALGSVAERVVRYCGEPVLVVRSHGRA